MVLIEVNSDGRVLNQVKNNSTASQLFYMDGEAYAVGLPPRKEDFLRGVVNYDQPWIEIENEFLIFISMPCAPHHELFCAERPGGGYILGSCLFEVAEILSTGSLDNSAVEYFLKKGTFPSGRTILNEISRLKPGNLYEFLQNQLISVRHSLQRTQTAHVTYSEFKEKFEGVLEAYGSGKQLGVLLSGGVDSAAIALGLTKLGHAPKAFTGVCLPRMAESEIDFEGSARLAHQLEIPLHISEVDFEKLSIEDFRPFVRTVPMGVHLCIVFDTLLKDMVAQNIEVAFCGQNLDNLYNLGATSLPSLSRAGLSDLFRRWFLSFEYARAVGGESVSPKALGPMMRISGHLGAFLYSCVKHERYRAPSNAHEIVEAFNTSPDGVVFANGERMKSELEMRASDVFPNLFQNKVEEYMMSSASQTIRRSGDSQNISCIFPYSAEPMISVWRHSEMSLRDLFRPKKYIREYVREQLVPRKPPVKRARRIKAKGYHEWVLNFLTYSSAGVELNNFLPKHEVKGITNPQKLQRALAEFWLNEMRSILSSKGVVIS